MVFNVVLNRLIFATFPDLIQVIFGYLFANNKTFTMPSISDMIRREHGVDFAGLDDEDKA